MWGKAKYTKNLYFLQHTVSALSLSLAMRYIRKNEEKIDKIFLSVDKFVILYFSSAGCSRTFEKMKYLQQKIEIELIDKSFENRPKSLRNDVRCDESLK